MRSAGASIIDSTAGIKYQRTELEQLSHDSMMNDCDDDDEDESRKEYIFLIDRSGSMHTTIKLAREALKLFLYSLPANSKFNICSYGSEH